MQTLFADLGIKTKAAKTATCQSEDESVQTP
jgi:hypothetical protein